MEHYQATIAYDGSEFHGFQRQAEVRTVQACLETALATLQGGQPVRVRAAGRTDTGVHASGQVVDFFLPWQQASAALLRALNALLPDDIAVRALMRAPEGFHPRYDALSRTYIYTLYNHPVRHPLLQRYSYHERRPLDEQAMDQALQQLMGEQDFASFGRATGQSGSTVRRLIAGRVWREGELVRIKVEANAFLFRMVRGIVGALLPIGRHEEAPEWIQTVLAARDRGLVVPVAPMGLSLVDVHYPPS